MSITKTIPVRDAVVAYLSATGSSPSLVYQILAELHEPGVLPLDLLGDPVAVLHRGRSSSCEACALRRPHGPHPDRGTLKRSACATLARFITAPPTRMQLRRLMLDTHGLLSLM